MIERKNWLIAGASIALAAVVYAQVAGTSTRLLDASFGRLHGPPNTGVNGLMDLAVAINAGGALPHGWNYTDQWGRASIHLTGVEDPSTGEMAATVTAIDDSASMDYVEVWSGSQLLETATRANGMITKQGGLAVATIPISILNVLPIEHTVTIVSEPEAGGRRQRTSYRVEVDS